MDVMMPDMDGVEATRRIRSQWPADRQPRIIALTAHALHGDRERFLAGGMDDYLSKPIEGEELMRALSQCGKPAGETPDGPRETRIAREAEEGGDNAIRGQVLAQLRLVLGSDAEAMLPEFIQGFLHSGDELVEQMKLAAAQGQPRDLERAAHTLKSTSATLGIQTLAELAGQLEQRAAAGGMDGTAELVARIDAEYAGARIQLQGPW